MIRRVPLALALLGIALLAVGTGGFSATSADRGVSVAVVDDENALLGVENGAVALDNGNHSDVTLLALENQADSTRLRIADLTVETPPDERALDAGSPPKLYGVSVESNGNPTKRRIVADKVVCASNRGNEKRVIVGLTASSEHLTVELAREVVVECTGNPPADAPENGTPDGSD